MTYSYFSLFFIPLFKWDRHYFAEMTCCHTLYEITPEKGRQLFSGAASELTEEDLTCLRGGQSSLNGWTNQEAKKSITCPACGYEAEADYVYCPKCGTKLEK